MDDKPDASVDEDTSLLHQTEKKIEKRLTLLWHEIQEWQRDNHYITSGYRPQSNSYATSLASLGHLHNESVNIWTHLIGAVLAATAAIHLYLTLQPRFHHATADDATVFSCFFGGAVACLGMSATFHALSNHSERVAKFGNRLDYIGIILLIWGSFVPSIYYGFAQHPRLVRLYWSMITTIGAGTLVVVLYPKFRSPAWRPFRAFMFVMMGLSALFPVLHGVRLYGTRRMEEQMGLWWLVTQGALYIAGAIIYAVSRYPGHLRRGFLFFFFFFSFFATSLH
jgi:adiponectin receptor